MSSRKPTRAELLRVVQALQKERRSYRDERSALLARVEPLEMFLEDSEKRLGQCEENCHRLTEQNQNLREQNEALESRIVPFP